MNFKGYSQLFEVGFRGRSCVRGLKFLYTAIIGVGGKGSREGQVLKISYPALRNDRKDRGKEIMIFRDLIPRDNPLLLKRDAGFDDADDLGYYL
jgi:hypothetical protein